MPFRRQNISLFYSTHKHFYADSRWRSVDQQKIAEYSPLQTAISGILEIFQHVLGLAFVEITADERKQAG
jgi:Zn-dependent oligopeptidase